LLEGRPIGALNPTGRRARGLCAVPEERNGHAAVADLTLALNGALTARRRMGFVAAGLINMGRARAYASKVIGAFTVKALGHQSTAGSLSGGNLQKFIMGREILQEPSAIAVSQPTWGVDAGAATAIRQALVDLAGRGCAIIVISQDLDELLELCDSLVVINLGSLSRVLKVGEVSIEEIGLLMGGVHGDPQATVEMTEALHAH
jgi:general nucleoside transport system ATP-binding protein